jgi:hypothetical protein
MISEFHVFIDQASHLVVKSISYQFSPDAIENRSSVETYYDDYRLVQGVLLPYHSIRYVAGQKDSEISLKSITLNVGIPDSDFQVVN